MCKAAEETFCANIEKDEALSQAIERNEFSDPSLLEWKPEETKGDHGDHAENSSNSSVLVFIKASIILNLLILGLFCRL